MATEKGKGNMTVGEAGRLGGEKVASERGHAFYEEIGRKGGIAGGHKGGQRVKELIERGRRAE